MSRAQLRELGFASKAVDHRVATGRLHVVHRGVYAVGHPRITGRGHLWAAVLACGGPERAILSHRAAAAVWELMPQPATTDVTVRSGSRSTTGIRVHRSPTVETTTQPDGLPVTTPSRTLLDLASVLTEHRLERVCHRAEQLRLVDVERIAALGPRPGAARLRRALSTLERDDPRIARSELEERFLALVAEAGLDPPLVNAPVAGLTVDFHWPAQRLVVETDGAATHLTASAFESDRERDTILALEGLRVVRFTWRQVTERSDAVIDALRRLSSPPR